MNNQAQTTKYQDPAPDVLVRVSGVSKKFCLSLKKSLWYGLCDMGRELTGRRHGIGHGSSFVVPGSSFPGDKEELSSSRQPPSTKNPEPSTSGLRPKEFWAVHDVNFELKRGECLGLIGRNGAGKTTLLKMLNGLIKPDSGRIELRGRVGALIALGAGFNPILTGRENIYVNASVIGLTKREIDAKMDEIIDFAEIGDFMDTPVQNYSSGMAVRLGFAVASSLSPDIMLLDEVLAVGDANFQAKCFRRIGDNLANSAVILVSHNAYHIKKMCDRVVLLDHGRMVDVGPALPILSRYQEMSESEEASSLTVLGNEVAAARMICQTPRLRTGESLDLVLEMDVREKTCIANSYLNLADAAGVVHAQVDLAGMDGELMPGMNRLSLRVGPLHLAAGTYHGNLIVGQSGGKRTLVHLRHCFDFEFQGPLSMGPVYYPEVEIGRN